MVLITHFKCRFSADNYFYFSFSSLFEGENSSSEDDYVGNFFFFFLIEFFLVGRDSSDGISEFRLQNEDFFDLISSSMFSLIFKLYYRIVMDLVSFYFDGS